MRKLRPVRLLAVLALAGVAGALPGRAGAIVPGPVTFAPNVSVYTQNYGEPGLAVSPVDGTVYVTTPGSGGARWAKSTDNGLTWSSSKVVKPPSAPASATAGSDSDVAVAPDGTVYMADLTIDGIEVSKSTDQGATFAQQTWIPFSADREWVAADIGPHGEQIVYVAWHELATGTMLVEVSTDGAKTFGPPHPIYSQPVTLAESAHNGTSIGGIATTGKGDVYISYGVTRLDTTDTTNLLPPISEIHMGMSHDFGQTWSDVTVNPGAADANYGKFWMAAGADTAGNVYAVYSGCDHIGNPDHVWLQRSTDKGATWSAPYAVDAPGGSDIFGWVAGGGPGVAVVAWYHTDAASKDDGADQWVVDVAQVRWQPDGTPVNQTVQASDHVTHTGGICTLGIFCGVLPGSSSDRTLLDFFKVTVDPRDGMVELVWSDNSGKGPKNKSGVVFARQNGGESALDPTIYTS